MNQSYRIVLDQPVGIAVGFKPPLPDENLEPVIVVLDDGSCDYSANFPCVFDYSKFYHDEHGQSYVIVGDNGEEGFGITGPDGVKMYPDNAMLVFRSLEEFAEWQDDMLSDRTDPNPALRQAVNRYLEQHPEVKKTQWSAPEPAKDVGYLRWQTRDLPDQTPLEPWFVNDPAGVKSLKIASVVYNSETKTVQVGIEVEMDDYPPELPDA